MNQSEVLMTPANYIALATLFLGVAVAVGAMWTRLNARVRQVSDEWHEEMRRQRADIDTRINDTRDTYARRDDLDQHIGRIADGNAQILSALQAQGLRLDNGMSALSTRLDAILPAVSRTRDA